MFIELVHEYTCADWIDVEKAFCVSFTDDGKVVLEYLVPSSLGGTHWVSYSDPENVKRIRSEVWRLIRNDPYVNS